MEKELAISELANSGNFQSTHAAIGKLSKFTDFTNTEINEIVDAAISNRQVYWISEDSDVKAFMRDLVFGNESILSPDKLDKLKVYYPDNPA